MSDGYGAINIRLTSMLVRLQVLMTLLFVSPTIAAELPRKVDFLQDIQPLFDRYCVACHACNDAPCQLDLTHPAGLLRGANKHQVYDGTRVEQATPSRLFIDGLGEQYWRSRGFFPVIDADKGAESTLLKLLKTDNPAQQDNRLPDKLKPHVGRRHTCPTPEQTDAFIRRNPNAGMPLSFPAMKPSEIALITRWVDQGANIDITDSVTREADRDAIDSWEHWLNQSDPRNQLLSRWLFEHWHYARFYFDTQEAESPPHDYYRIIRSSTPPGTNAREIATRHPNDDAGSSFYYRLIKNQGTRVYKTHITFPLSDALQGWLNDAFLKPDWHVTQLPGYSETERANPFTTFEPLPVKARYQFMLNHAEYFVRTFIRGPVCRGQIATAVIRDHFWVLFQSPDTDFFVQNKAFRQQASKLLGLPSIESDLFSGARQWFNRSADRNRYLGLRQKARKELHPQGPDMSEIWDGGGVNTSALLTVFRHHDSATVKPGWIGQHPQTIWMLDYPLLERSYYNLVVNFDVFGSVSHQAQTRLYFDLIRNGAEVNFLRLLPPQSRQAVLDDWYQGSGMLKLWLAYQDIDADSPSQIPYEDGNHKAQLLDRILSELAAVNATPDPINRPAPAPLDNTRSQLSRLSGVSAAEMPAILQLSNASIIKIVDESGAIRIYTMIRNRQHSNVAFILGEELRYQSEKDSLTLVEGIATSYPNFIYHVPERELTAFVKTLRSESLRDPRRFKQKLVNRWGIERHDPAFWDHFHEINDYLREKYPIEAGLLDIYRYQDHDINTSGLVSSMGIAD